jgi:hypothetical protein
MAKDVHLFQTYHPLFLLNFLETWKLVFGVNQHEIEFIFFN